MIKLNFTIREFLIHRPNSVNVLIADKIVKHHIAVIQPIRNKLGFPIFVSKGSGYRPVAWEAKHGRSGTSEHCFKGKGAADYSCKTEKQLLLLLTELQNSVYTRICYYPKEQFIHCDYKGCEPSYFECINNQWLCKTAG